MKLVHPASPETGDRTPVLSTRWRETGLWGSVDCVTTSTSLTLPSSGGKTSAVHTGWVP